MSELRKMLLEGIDDGYEKSGGQTPDHVILPRSMKEEVSLEQLGTHREYSINRVKGRGLLGMQVWFSDSIETRGKYALLVSDDVFKNIFNSTTTLL